ncbi:hypothetical protein FHETE_1845 [Fusarium heterosporum]|uniref:Uncharacterized protein n=1 Tax=Fusarium heterosporum TaxID=42747 RepID=A0A8H5TVF1_FUSHE|nr:hypothetical protein FHETE_1845 [Fusarium heterosporum]
MTTETKSSGLLKFIAFLDLVVKLAATGALIGILVMLVKFDGKFNKILNGREFLQVRISDSPTRITSAYASQFQVEMTNNRNNPVWFRADT